MIAEHLIEIQCLTAAQAFGLFSYFSASTIISSISFLLQWLQWTVHQFLLWCIMCRDDSWRCFWLSVLVLFVTVCYVDMGHSRPGAVPESWRCILSWCRLLHPCVWCVKGYHIPCSRQLAWWVPYTSQSSWPRSLSIRCCRKQSWSGCERGMTLNLMLNFFSHSCGGGLTALILQEASQASWVIQVLIIGWAMSPVVLGHKLDTVYHQMLWCWCFFGTVAVWTSGGVPTSDAV